MTEKCFIDLPYSFNQARTKLRLSDKNALELFILQKCCCCTCCNHTRSHSLSSPHTHTHHIHIHIEGKRKREREIERKRKRERERERVIHTNTDIQDQSHITAYYYIDCVYSIVNHKPSNESVLMFLFSSQKYFL